MVGDGLRVVGEAEILQGVEEQRGAVIKCSYGHLQAHGPQLAGLHLPRQTLQRSAHKQGDDLRDQVQRFKQKTLWLRISCL